MTKTTFTKYHQTTITNLPIDQAWQDQLCRPCGQRDDEEDEERGENLGGGEQHQQEPHGNPQRVVLLTRVMKIIRFALNV